MSGPSWEGNIEELIRKLAEVESEIANSTSNQADSVLDPMTSMPILLRHTQTALLRANDELETQVKQRTSELAFEKERLEAVTRNIGAGLAIISRDYRTIWANKVLKDIFGDCVGEICYAHYNQREGICPGCGVREIIETGTEKTVYEQEGKDSAGNTIWSQIIATPIRDKGGNITAVLELVVPITERKLAEKALQDAHDGLERMVRERTAEMERFIYTVSHDLRSPLVTVSGFVGLLKEDLEKADYQRAFSDLLTMNGAITKMDLLLMDTLELSRIGRVINSPKEVPFDQIVQEALEQTAHRIKSGNVTVSVAQDLPKVCVDMPRIVEVLVNLIENSVKYMGDQERPTIEIGSRKDGEETAFFIKDNGMGIDLNEHEKVFGLFYKVDKRSNGTGAGLAIVKRIIEVHGGRVWIESELGKGCTVCFTLPLTDGSWPPLGQLNTRCP